LHKIKNSGIYPLFFYFPAALRAGYHFWNHHVNTPNNAGKAELTRLINLLKSVCIRKKVQIGVQRYNIPQQIVKIRLVEINNKLSFAFFNPPY